MYCNICNEETGVLGRHLNKEHKDITAEEYYNKYLKEDPNEGVCPTCGEPTKFLGLTKGYRHHCSTRCFTLDKNVAAKRHATNMDRYGDPDFNNMEKQRKTNEERYGDASIFRTDHFKKQSKITNKKKYGTDYYSESDSFKQKMKEINNNNRTEEEWRIIEDKKRATSLERYGVPNIMQAESTKEKFKQTSFENYGVDHPMKSQEIKDKLADSNNNKYGVSCTLMLDEVRDKIAATMIRKYGVNNCLKDPEIYKKVLVTKKKDIEKFCIENNMTKVVDLIEKYGIGWLHSGKFETIKYKNITFVKNDVIKDIEKYFNVNNSRQRSHFEVEVLNYIKTFYKGNIVLNSKNIIAPQELDIYLPDIKLAIECNGYYWHSTNNETPVNYHLIKTEKCKNKEIRLIHIIDIEWTSNKDGIKSWLKNIILDSPFKAEEFEVKEIDLEETNSFLNKHHPKGSYCCLHNFGMFSEGELIGVVAYDESDSEFILKRIISKSRETSLILFERSLELISNIKTVSAYVDKSKFDVDDYIYLGFKHIDDTDPSYAYYSRDGGRITKEQLERIGLSVFLGDRFDSNKTEFENMKESGWFQVFDCGSYEMRYDCENI